MARRERWLLGGAVLLVYGTLAPARPFAELLRSRGLLLPTVLLAAIGAGLWLLRELGSGPGEDRDSTPPLALATSLAAAALLWSRFDLPEERFHMPLYAVLGLLSWRVFSDKPKHALLCAATIGIGDELIQGLLPARFFDLSDLLTNVGVGCAVVLLRMGGRASHAAPLGLLIAAAAVTASPRSTVDDAPRAPTTSASSIRTFPPGVDVPAKAQVPDPSAPHPGANLILITVDALRADFVPGFGAPRTALPTFERLEAESERPRAMLASGHWTSPGVISLLTGLHAPSHGVLARGLDFAPGPVTPLESLRAAGYLILGAVDGNDENYANLGLDLRLAPRDVKQPERALERAIEREGLRERPFFAWLHLRDIHVPYDSSEDRLRALGLDEGILPLADEPILQRAREHYTVPRASYPGTWRWLQPTLQALYAAEVVAADERLGRVLQVLEQEGLLERSLIVVTADHGEELLEYDGIGHASSTLDSVPYPELLRIPLYIRRPGAAGGGRVLPLRMTQADVLPTVLPLLGLHAQDPVPGVPLDGVDYSAYLGERPPTAPAAPSLLAGAAPCGWQCPDERRGERVYALYPALSDPGGRLDPRYCRDPGPACAFSAELDRAHRKAERLQSPIKHRLR